MKLGRAKKELTPAELVGAGLFTMDALVMQGWGGLMEGAGREAEAIAFAKGVSRSLADGMDARLAFYRTTHDAWPPPLASQVASLLRNTHLRLEDLTTTWHELQSDTRASYARQGAEVLGAAQDAHGGPDTFARIRAVVAEAGSAETIDATFASVALDGAAGWLADVLEGKTVRPSAGAE